MGMDDLAPAVDARDPIAETRRELLIMERIGRELVSRVERGEAGMERLIRRHLDEIHGRLAAALSGSQSGSRTTDRKARTDDA